MKSFAFALACVLMAAGAFAAPPQGVPAAGTAAMPCPGMSSGMMGNCAGMQGKPMGPGMMGKGPCPAMHGGQPASGSCPCPCMRTAAPGAVSKMGPAGSTNPAVYGWQLMTPAEKQAYRDKLHAAKTPEERAKIRAEHHKEMEARAKAQGVTLPPGPATH